MDNRSRLFEQLPKGSISEIIIQRITDSLVNGELKPGDKIPTEIEFSDRLGVGRNAVREAIKVLVAFGVLEIRRSEGTFVVDHFTQNLLNPLLYGLILSNESMQNLLEFKISIYGSILYFAARNATGEDIEELRRLHKGFHAAMLEKPGDFDKMYQTSKAFNEYLGKMAKNPMILQLDEISLKIANYTRVKAIEVSVERDIRSALPDSYLKDVELIANRDKRGIADLLDEKLTLWQELLL